MKKLATIVLVLFIMMGVYCFGTEYTYDPFVHLEKIAEITDELPDLQTLGDIWNDDYFYPKEHGMRYIIPYTEYNTASLNDGVMVLAGPGPGGGFTGGGGNGPVGNGPNAFYIIDESADWGVFEVVRVVINSLSLFSYKMLYTLQFLGIYIFTLFKIVGALLPTSGLVLREV